MECLVNDRRVRYNPYNMKKDILLGEGMEGKVYKIGDKAVKIYKPFSMKSRLDKEKAIMLSNINTKRILTPDEVILSKKRKIVGYSTKYVENLDYDNLLNLDRDKLKDELKKMKDDLILLSDNNVILEDINYNNTVFNDGIYFVDPGSYTIVDDYDKVLSYGINEEKINDYLIDLIYYKGSLKLTSKQKIASNLRKLIDRDYFDNYYFDIFTYLMENVKEKNLLEHIKMKVK